MPNLGIIASSISGKLSTNSYESIATVTVGSGGTSSLSFTSIPSTYTHLQIRLLGRSTDAAGTVNVNMSLNSTVGSSWHRVYGNGTSLASNGQASATAIIGQISGATAASGIFASAVIDLLDYANTNKYKTMKSLFGFDDNNGGAGGVVQFFGALYQTTAAVSSITITSGAGLAQYTSAALYGIKG